MTAVGLGIGMVGFIMLWAALANESPVGAVTSTLTGDESAREPIVTGSALVGYSQGGVVPPSLGIA